MAEHHDVISIGTGGGTLAHTPAGPGADSAGCRRDREMSRSSVGEARCANGNGNRDQLMPLFPRQTA